MALFGFLKKSDSTFKLHDKDIKYKIDESDKFFHIVLGVDGKLKNAWNEPILLKLTLNKENDSIIFYVTKSAAGISDSKPVYSSTGSKVYADIFPLTDDEIKQLTNLIHENME